MPQRRPDSLISPLSRSDPNSYFWIGYRTRNMSVYSLQEFVSALEKEADLYRVSSFTDPVLEMCEIADRLVKNQGRALLFENTGTDFPVLMNMYASPERIAKALHVRDLEAAKSEIGRLFEVLLRSGAGGRSLRSLPTLLQLASYMPRKRKGRGQCQEVIHRDPDLSILPVLKCWPHDGGRFITLPMVHTVDPELGTLNVGMYRVQIMGQKLAAMHWHRHKTGAVHYEKYRKAGKKMPVAVALGGDPVYAYSATAPLPENINEYILAGFLRKKKVKLVKCRTQEIWVPENADIVIEGYIDPSEDTVLEGPFGDHTGFYSLEDQYPRFHITCITHRKKAIYPATIVGVPPMEDAWLAEATEKIFLNPIKMSMLPEITDLHMPSAGVAHNLALVSIEKRYPGQGQKVIHSLLGAGQMMFAKYLCVFDKEVNLRDYREVARALVRHARIGESFVLTSGPLDVLDHAADQAGLGGKLGIDATRPLEPEDAGIREEMRPWTEKECSSLEKWLEAQPWAEAWKPDLLREGIPLLLLALKGKMPEDELREQLEMLDSRQTWFVLLTDGPLLSGEIYHALWYGLGNSDPQRDLQMPVRGQNNLFVLDGRAKGGPGKTFPRDWPEVVVSDEKVRKTVDEKWKEGELGEYRSSPSDQFGKLTLSEGAAWRKK